VPAPAPVPERAPESGVSLIEELPQTTSLAPSAPAKPPAKSPGKRAKPEAKSPSVTKGPKAAGAKGSGAKGTGAKGAKTGSAKTGGAKTGGAKTGGAKAGVAKASKGSAHKRTKPPLKPPKAKRAKPTNTSAEADAKRRAALSRPRVVLTSAAQQSVPRTGDTRQMARLSPTVNAMTADRYERVADMLLIIAAAKQGQRVLRGKLRRDATTKKMIAGKPLTVKQRLQVNTDEADTVKLKKEARIALRQHLIGDTRKFFGKLVDRTRTVDKLRNAAADVYVVMKEMIERVEPRDFTPLEVESLQTIKDIQADAGRLGRNAPATSKAPARPKPTEEERRLVRESKKQLGDLTLAVMCGQLEREADETGAPDLDDFCKRMQIDPKEPSVWFSLYHSRLGVESIRRVVEYTAGHLSFAARIHAMRVANREQFRKQNGDPPLPPPRPNKRRDCHGFDVPYVPEPVRA
jgi:hypothetical protein